MKNYLFLIWILFLSNFYGSGQGRKVDTELVVLTPKAEDTIISRIKGSYNAKFIIKNNGPDSIKKSDKYGIDISFGNVLYGFYFRYPSRIILPGSEDTVAVQLQMTWDTDNNNTTFCGTVYLSGYGNDSIKKETKSEFLNNKQCQKVAHDSRLYLSEISLENVKIYPIPSNGIIQVELTNNSFIPSSIRITNCIGKLIRTLEPSFKNNSTSFDLSEIPRGIYYVQLSNSQNKITKALILN